MKDRIKDFIEFAIANERDAAQLYERCATGSTSILQKQLFSRLSEMEREHERKLSLLFNNENPGFTVDKIIPDLHISDYMEVNPLTDNSSFQDAIVFAMKAEQKAFELYDSLAKLEEDPQTKSIFEALANEEKKHKFDLETEYEQNFMSEN